MRIMCVLVSLMIFLVLSSGCSEAEEKRDREKSRTKRVEPEAGRAELLRKKTKTERKKAELRAKKVKLLREKAKIKKPGYILPALLVIKNIQKPLLKRLGLTHLKEEQVRELFKKLMPLIRRMHPLEKQAQELEMRADVLMEQGQVEEVMTLRFKAMTLEMLLEPLKEQVRVLRATHRKKKRNMRTIP